MSDRVTVFHVVPLQLQGFQRRGSGEAEKRCRNFEHFSNWNMEILGRLLQLVSFCLLIAVFLLNYFPWTTRKNSKCVANARLSLKDQVYNSGAIVVADRPVA